MISCWTPGAGAFTVHEYLRQRGAPIAHRFDVRLYESLDSPVRARGGAHIFAATDQLPPNCRELVAHLWDAMREAAPTWRLLNDPRRVLLRQPFLSMMAERGLNDFRVFPAMNSGNAVRYPVFLRERNRHDGPLTGLLGSPVEVRRAMRALRMRGHRAEELIQVEFLDTADADGRYRKYSAFLVGDAIVRSNLQTSREWSVKSEASVASGEFARDELAYVSGDAHEDWLRRVFALANIDFGRIDYGVVNGRPQAWEINLNPTIARRLDEPQPPMSGEAAEVREEGRKHVHAQLRAAFVALDVPSAGPTEVMLALPPQLLERMHREQQVVGRQQRLLAFGRAAFHAPAAWPVRFVYGKLWKRG